MSKTKIFISGPMSGHPDFNYPAFDQAYKFCTALGYDVLSPAHDSFGNLLPAPKPGEEKPWEHYMRLSLAKLLECDAIFLLDGWEKSRGACLEHDLAGKLGINFIPQAYAERIFDTYVEKGITQWPDREL